MVIYSQPSYIPYSIMVISFVHVDYITFVGQYWPAPPDDPQGIRVASVIEFSVCLSVLCSHKIF